MRSLLAISVVVLVCFVNLSCGSFVDFFSNLPMEISRAFGVAWGSMEDAIKHPVQIVRIGSGGKLKTTTVSIKKVIIHEQTTESLLVPQIYWKPIVLTKRQPEGQTERQAEQQTERQAEHQTERQMERQTERQTKQLIVWPSSRRIEWYLTGQPDRKLEQNHELMPERQSKRLREWQSEWQPQLKLEQNHEQKPYRQPLQKLELNHALRPELHLERQPTRQPKDQPKWKAERQPQRKLEQNHKLRPGRQPLRKLELSHEPKTELHLERQPGRWSKWQSEQQPKWQAERQPERHRISWRQHERQSKSNFDLTEFEKRHTKLTIPILEEPRNRSMSNSIMRIFHDHKY